MRVRFLLLKFFEKKNKEYRRRNFIFSKSDKAHFKKKLVKNKFFSNSMCMIRIQNFLFIRKATTKIYLRSSISCLDSNWYIYLL